MFIFFISFIIGLYLLFGSALIINIHVFSSKYIKSFCRSILLNFVAYFCPKRSCSTFFSVNVRGLALILVMGGARGGPCIAAKHDFSAAAGSRLLWPRMKGGCVSGAIGS